MKSTMKREKKKENKYDGGLFRMQKVVQYLDKIDKTCWGHTKKVFTELQDHVIPTVATVGFQAFIDELSSIFGNM